MSTLELPQMPASVRDLAQLIGVEGAIALVRAYGGYDYVEIPGKARSDHPLVRHIGLTSLERLVDVYGGDRLHIPRASRALKSLRNQEIVAKYDEGSKVNDLGREYGLSSKQIRIILKHPPANTVQ